MGNMIPILLGGLGTSLKLFFFALLFSLPVALPVALGRMSKRWYSYPVRLYQLIMRGTPLMLQLMVVNYGPYYIITALNTLGLNLTVWTWPDKFTPCVVAFSLNYAAYFAEIYRGGIESIPSGQYEAGKVLGLTRSQTFFRIVLPQVVKRILPACSNEFMTLIKDTALAMTIAQSELLRKAETIANREVSLVPFLVAGLFYLVVNTIVEQGFNLAEKKLSYYQ